MLSPPRSSGPSDPLWPMLRESILSWLNPSPACSSLSAYGPPTPPTGTAIGLAVLPPSSIISPTQGGVLYLLGPFLPLDKPTFSLLTGSPGVTPAS